MKTRSDKSFLGGENIDFKHESSEFFIEQIILVIVSLACVIFFLAHPHFLQKSFKLGKIKVIFGLFLFLILSPFGAHLITFVLSIIWKKLRCVIQK